LTGTFYLLAVAAAVAVGALLAFAGFSMPAQFGLAAVVAVAFVFWAHRWRLAQGHGDAPAPSPDVGQPVTVQAWSGERARVAYRGTLWDGELASPEESRDKPLYIAAVRGSLLVLTNRAPSAS
jgi:membrane protein implicated in regulation of membrane protease activity